MITQEEIDKAADIYSKDIYAVNKNFTIEVFKASVEWALEKLQEKLQDESIDKAVENVTRFEVIDHSKDFKGRCYVKYDCSIELSLQDGNRTLKVFIKDATENK